MTEELLLRRFIEFDREVVRKMFQLHDIRKSKVWQEAHETGIEEGEARANERLIRKLLAKGTTVKEIAGLLEISIKEVRQLFKDAPK